MTIAAERLTEGRTIFVRGKISFSRLAAQITGAELARSVEQARKRGSLYPTTKPHTTISLVDAQVIPVDPANPTLEEQFVAEKLYQVKTGDNAGKTGYSIDDTSPTLPVVFAPGDDGKHRQVILESDLDSGLDVTLVLRTFKAGDYAKRGLNLAQVILNEDLRYYQAAGGPDPAALAALGITLDGPVTRVQASEATAAQGGEESATATVTNSDGLALPGPVADTAPVQTQAPAAQQAAPQPAAQPAAQQPAPAVAASPQDEVARLKAQLAALQASQGAPGSSAFDANQEPASPWQPEQNPGISL